METIPFSYAYAYVTPGLHGLSYAYVYACAYAYVVRVNQAFVRCDKIRENNNKKRQVLAEGISGQYSWGIRTYFISLVQTIA